MQSLLLSFALALPGQPPTQIPESIPAPAPAVPQVPVPPAVVIHAAGTFEQPLLLEQFVQVFRPEPGIHQIWFAHPKTNRPVFVCFTLPAGAPKVRHGSRYVKFDYGRHEVEVTFRASGKVLVEY